VRDNYIKYIANGKYKLAFNKMTGTVLQFITFGKIKFQEQIAIATGERNLFESQVDAAEKLGMEVHFDSPQRTEFYYTDTPQVFASVSGKRLDAAVCDALGVSCDSNEQVTIACRTKKGYVQVNGQDNLQVPFDQIEGITAGVQCTLPVAEKQEDHFEQVQAEALFPFRTAGYARTPFLTTDVFRRLEAERYDIETYVPQTTPGPVKISFSGFFDPITVYEGESFVNTKSFAFEIVHLQIF
jgi:hypothetical protein